MGAPKAPTVVVQPTPASTENEETQEEIAKEQLKARQLAAKAMGRSKTMLSGSDVNPVTGESAGASLLGG